MKNPGDLSALFSRFAGREVPMKEEPFEIELKSLGMTHKGVNISPADENDPVLKEMHEEAKKNGLSLRVWWKGVVGTMDYRTDRVNAHIEKGDDGKWRVSPRFNIG